MAGDDITVDVESLARRLTQQQENAAATEQRRIMMNTHRVSRVSDHVRGHNKHAYTPGLVAIGPLHAANRRLRAGTRLKMAYLHRLISRGHPDPASHLAVIQGYVRLVTVREREARAMYAAEDVDISAEDFIQMLVLDGCFIIEHLINVTTGVEEALLRATPFGPVRLSVDLVLAENQIPFFVLVDLIKSTRLPEFDGTWYQPTDLLMKLVQYYLGGEKGRAMRENEGLPAANDVCHILHLLHAMITAARTRWEPPTPKPSIQDSAVLEMARDAAWLLPRLPFLLLVPLLYPTLPEGCRWSARYVRGGLLPSASDLKRMWVRIKKANGTAKATAGIASSVLGPVPLAMKLVEKNRLCLPQLRIEFRTAPLLLNLMAFEQSSADQRAGDGDGDVSQSFPVFPVPDHQDVSQSRPVGHDVSAYVWFMTRLVQSPEDAGVLLAAEVVRISTSGSKSKEEVARFFWQLGAVSEAAELEKSYLGPMLAQLSSYSDQPRTKRADVQRYYIDAPWRLVVAFVAVVTTVGSIIQTVISIPQTFASFKQKP